MMQSLRSIRVSRPTAARSSRGLVCRAVAMKASWNGKVIAESDATIVVEGNHYFPPSSLRKEFFEDSTHKSFCGWKGECSYKNVVVDGQTNPNAAWYYPASTIMDGAKAKGIGDYYAFWKGVSVEA